MTIEEQIESFRNYSEMANFKYNDNGPDWWVCPVCDYSQEVIYVQSGVREPKPRTSDLESHAPDCPWHKDNIPQRLTIK